jgi:hypothetical protein
LTLKDGESAKRRHFSLRFYMGCTWCGKTPVMPVIDQESVRCLVGLADVKLLLKYLTKEVVMAQQTFIQVSLFAAFAVGVVLSVLDVQRARR